jgi:hypothetical protein
VELAALAMRGASESNGRDRALQSRPRGAHFERVLEDLMLSKRWLGVLALVGTTATACSSSDGPTAPTSGEKAGGTTAAQIANPFACTPLLQTSMPFLSCGALSQAGITTAATIQTQLVSQLNLALASVTLMPDWANNQVVISSAAAEFSTFFGMQITAPLMASGFFMTSVPLTLAGFPDGFALTCNIFGLVPGVLGAANPAVFAPAITPVVAGAGAVSATTSASFSASSTTTLAAASMPVSFFITTPIGVAAPLTCSGALPLTCL